MPINRNPKSLWQAAIKCIIKTIRHRKDRSINHFEPPKNTIKYYEENFKMLHRKIKKTGKCDDEKFYNKIILLNNIEDLYFWVAHVQSVIEKEAKVPEKKISKFNFWSKKKEKEEKEEVPVEETYEKIFSDMNAAFAIENTLIPKSYIRVKFDLNLGSGIFKLVKPSITGGDGLVFSYNGLSTSVSLKVQGLDLSLSMKDLSLSSFNNHHFSDIIKKGSTDEMLWILNFNLKPNDHLAWCLVSVFQSLEINYNQAFLNLLLSFFVVPKTHDSIKNAAWDTIKGIQDTTHEALNDLLHGESVYSIQVICSGPKIRIPSPTHQGYFLLNSGDIFFNNLESSTRYENFNITMSSLGLKYELNHGAILDIIPAFEIKSLLQILKSKYKLKKKQDNPIFIIESKLPVLTVILDASIFHQLQRLPEMFKYEKNDEKDLKFTDAKYKGKIKKLVGMNAWKEHDAVLLGSYLYFYNPERFGGNTSSFFYIKDCSIQDISEDQQIPYCIHLQNIYGDCVFAVSSEQDFERWKLVLNESINEFESRTSLATKKTVSESDRIICKFKFEAPKANIQLKTENSEMSAEIDLSNMVTEITTKDSEYVLIGTLRGMEILEDHGHKFSKLFLSKDCQDLIKLNLKCIDSKSPKYRNQDYKVKVRCGVVDINWNYHLITKLLNFFQFAEYSDPTLTLRETREVAKDHTFLNFSIKTNEICIYLNNNKTQLSLAKVLIQGFESTFLVQTEGNVWKGVLGNLEISDMTNYPATALDQACNEFKIFTVRENSKLMQFNIIMYSENYKDRDMDVGNVVDVELNSIDLVYIHQPIMRIVDYLNYHVLGAFDTQSRAREIEDSSIFKPKVSEEKLSFTSLIVKINQPIVYIPPRPRYPAYFVINLGTITIKNKLNKADNPGWVDIISLQMEKLLISSNKVEITEEFDVSLEIHRKLLKKSHLQQKNLDKAYKIYGSCKGIKLNLSQRDYNLLIRIGDLNTVYDDQLESYISPTYTYSEPVPGEFITLDFKIQTISVLFTMNNVSIFELLCIDQGIDLVKYNNNTMKFNYNSAHVLGLIGESSVTSKDPEFKTMANDVFTIPYESLIEYFEYSEYHRLSYILFGSVSSTERVFEVSLITSLDGTKNIELNFKYIRINFHLSLFYQILNYFTSGMPNYTAAVDTPQDYITKYRPTKEMILKEIGEIYCAPKISALCSLNKSFIILPSTKKLRTMVAQSDLSYSYVREKENSNIGPDVAYSLILENFEIFHAKYEDLQKFSSLNKNRKALEPLQIIYEIKDYKKAAQVIENIMIDSLKCALSYHDMVLMQSSYGFQLEMLKKDKKLIETLESFSDLQVTEDRMSQNLDNLVMEKKISNKLISFTFAGLNIIIINDALTAYSPILDISMTISDKIISDNDAEGGSKMKGSFEIWSSYYNPIADVWEPFIEPFQFEIERIDSKVLNIKSQYIFSVLSEVLNVNCSEVMIKNLKDVLDIWDTSTECQEIISPFRISNQIGYSVLLQYKYSQEVSVLDSEASVDYLVDYYCREKKLEKSDSVYVTIFPGDFQPPKMRIKTNKVQSNVYHSQNQFIIVDIELQATRKTLSIRSPVIIENQTEFPLKLGFYKPDKNEVRECLQHKQCPVPYDFIRSSMTIEINGAISRKPINLDELWCQLRNYSNEIVVHDIYLCLYYKISKNNSKKRTLILKPTLEIKNSLPCPIGLKLYQGKPSKFKEIEIQPNEIHESYQNSMHSELAFSISIENFTKTNLLPLLSNNSSKFKIYDRKNQELYINLLRIQKGNNLCVFYVSQVIINNTLNGLAFYQEQQGSEKLIPGQDFEKIILPCNMTNKILVGLGNKRSKAFKIDSVGVNDIIEINSDPSPSGYRAKYQYTLDVQISKVLKNQMAFTKVIIVCPRYLIVNNTEHDILIAQDGLLDHSILAPSGSRIPYHWTDGAFKELIRFKGKDEFWNWSGAFPINSIGSFAVQSKHSLEVSTFLMVKVDIKIIATTAHIVLEKIQLTTAPYRIINDSGIFSLAIYQRGSAEDTRYIDACSSILFAWSDHLSPHEIIIEFIIGRQALEGKDTKSMYFLNLDKLNQVLKINIKEAEKDFDVLYVNISNDGVTRVLKFSDMPLNDFEDVPDTILTYYNITIPKIGISLIEHFKQKNKELLYMSLIGLVALVQNTKKEWKAELIIKTAQIDNQMSADVIFPVLMHPTEASERNIFHGSMILNKVSNENCRNFETFEFLLQAFCLNLDSVCASNIIGLTTRVWLSNDTIPDLFEVLREFKSLSVKSEVNASQVRTYYFSFLKIHPIKILINFVPVKQENNKKDFLSGIASFGMALTTLESAPIKLYSIQLAEVLASEKRLKDSLKKHYKSQLVNEFYSLIGHSNILGNPIGLLNHLGTGVVDFFYEPAQGMINGPISAGEGILKGTGSLIKNTLSGTFGTVSKLTSSITTGLTALTQDKDYIMDRQRDLAKNKPSNIVDGVGLGIFSLFKNVGQGITGLVTEPIKGFKKDKFEGMMIGGLKGVSGLVVKPIAGALDMVSRSAEGIKNTANIFDKTTQYKKMRLPRVIYGPSHLIQVYNQDDSMLMQYFYKIGKKKYCEKEFIEKIQGLDIDNKSVFVIFFTDLLVYMNSSRGKIIWKIEYKNINGFELIKNNFLINAKNEKAKPQIFKVEFKNPDDNATVERKLINIIKSSLDNL